MNKRTILIPVTTILLLASAGLNAYDYDKAQRSIADRLRATSDYLKAFVEALVTVEQCQDRGGTWTEGACKCPAGKAEVPSWNFGAGRSEHYCIPECSHEGQTLEGASLAEFQCVCDEGDFWVPSGDLHADGSPQCMKPVANIKVRFKTGTIEDAGTDSEFVLVIGHEAPDSDLPLRSLELWDAGYIHAFFDDSGPLTLNAGDVDSINFLADQEGVTPHPYTTDSMENFYYPEDFHFAGVYPVGSGDDCELSFWGGLIGDSFTGFDGWYLAELKIQVQLKGESAYRTVYNDTSVDDWIDFSDDSCLSGMQSSEHFF